MHVTVTTDDYYYFDWRTPNKIQTIFFLRWNQTEGVNGNEGKIINQTIERSMSHLTLIYYILVVGWKNKCPCKWNGMGRMREGGIVENVLFISEFRFSYTWKKKNWKK